MADAGLRILLIASAVVLVLAVIDVARLIRTRHAAGSVAGGVPGAHPPGSPATDPADTDPAGKAGATAIFAKPTDTSPARRGQAPAASSARPSAPTT